MVSKQSKSFAAFVRPSSPKTIKVVMPCGVQNVNKSLFKTKVESIVGQISNPLKFKKNETLDDKISKMA